MGTLTEADTWLAEKMRQQAVDRGYAGDTSIRRLSIRMHHRGLLSDNGRVFTAPGDDFTRIDSPVMKQIIKMTQDEAQWCLENLRHS